MKLSIIVPTLTGQVPESVKRAAEGSAEVEIVVVKGVSPVGKARNEGLRKAKGEYIAWVDSDDEVTEDWLDEILNSITHPSSPTPQQLPDVITFDIELIGWNGRKEYTWGVHEATNERLLRDVCRDMNRPSSMWAYVLKRELWNGFEFDESLDIAEDYVLLPRLLMKAKGCVYIPQKLYRYQYNSLSLVNSLADEKRAWLCEIMEKASLHLPQPYRRARLWGMALNFFWGRVNRYFVRRHLREILCETWLGPDLTPWDRLKTTLRFLWFSCGGGR